MDKMVDLFSFVPPGKRRHRRFIYSKSSMLQDGRTHIFPIFTVIQRLFTNLTQ